MPPKGDNPETAELIELFKSIGLTQSKAAEAAKSSKSAAVLKEIIETNKLSEKQIEEKQAVLLASLAVQGSKLGEREREYAVEAILNGRLKTTDQVSGMQMVQISSGCADALEHSCVQVSRIAYTTHRWR